MDDDILCARFYLCYLKVTKQNTCLLPENLDQLSNLDISFALAFLMLIDNFLLLLNLMFIDATRIWIALAWWSLFFSLFLLIQHKVFCLKHHWIWFNSRINFMLLILYLVMNWESYLKLKFIIFWNLHENILYHLNSVNRLTLK